MNRRDYKQFAKNSTYHIYNRGVNKMNIFEKEYDYRVFLFRLKENLFPDAEKSDRFKLPKRQQRRKLLPPNSFDLIAYCLMPNHFHLLIQQKTELPITKLISKVCTGYSKYFNKTYERVGQLFQDQFKSVTIENNEQLLWTSFYIHKNPVEAQIVKYPEHYNWSSYIEYLENNYEICNKKIILEQFNNPQKYFRYFKKDNEPTVSLKHLYFDFDE